MPQDKTPHHTDTPPPYREALDAIRAKLAADSKAATADLERAQKEHPVLALFGYGNEAYKKKLDTIEKNAQGESLALVAATDGISAAAHGAQTIARKKLNAHPEDRAEIEDEEIRQLKALLTLTQHGDLRLTRDEHGKAALALRGENGKTQTYELGTGTFHAEPAATGDSRTPAPVPSIHSDEKVKQR